MIVVLCSSYEEAVHCFYIFLEFLEENFPWNIKRVFNVANCIETDDDLKYVFVDYRFEKLFDKADCINVDEFYEGIDDYEGIEDYINNDYAYY